jgi:protein involved in sex pheromone biosynthesis
VKRILTIIFLSIILLYAGCVNQFKDKDQPAPTISKEDSKSQPTKVPPKVSSVDFNIDSYKGTDDYDYVKVVYDNLIATVNKDHTAFSKTFLPDVDTKTYDYVMNQVERYYKIDSVNKTDKEITVDVLFQTNFVYQDGTIRTAGRAYLLRKSASGEWLLYTID